MCSTNDNSRTHAPIERLPSFVGRSKASRAAVVRTLSGQAAGVGARSRRGSFLILVVGVLALLSVIAVLYATVGSGDRQRASAVVQKAALDDYPQRVGDYLAGVIGKDALGTMFEVTPDGTAHFSRESWDYPFTDWNATSFIGFAGGNEPLFTPTGDARLDASGAVIGGAPLQWIPGDPYLATIEPEFLGFDGSNYQATTVDQYYLERRDWAHISNPGPEGRFVNLANLRGNFEAPSRSLTAGLTIPGRNGSNASIQTIPGITLDSHHPAHYDSRQIGAFRPMFDNFAPGDFKHIHNQWADADGDGFADSRWFELVDASKSDPGAPSLLNEFPIIPHDPSIRYFVAARIIDLSGLVNVNTASDQMSAPDKDRLIGSSPGDVDLRALLTQAYQRDLQPQGYDTLFFSLDRGVQRVQDYGVYDANAALSSGHYAYQAAKLSLAASIPVPPKDVLAGGSGGSAWVGDLLGGTNVGAALTFAQQFNLHPDDVRQLWDFDTRLTNAPLSEAEARYRAYRERRAGSRGVFMATSGTTPNVASISNRFIFAEDDLLELLKYHGTNDPSITSTLEMVLGGRGTIPTTGVVTARDLSPLRDNRELYNERPESLRAPATDDTQWEQFRLAKMVDIRQRLTTFSGAREIRLSADVAPDHLGGAEGRINPLGSLQLAGSNWAAAGQHPVDLAFSTLFNGYLDALAPYLSEGNSTTNLQNFAWNNTGNPGQAQRSQTLFYGHQGPEFAYITSAMLALNMVDKFDRDSVPQARTLLIDNDFRANLALDANQPRFGQPFPWWHSQGGDADPVLLDPSLPRDTATIGGSSVMKLAASSRNDQVDVPAVNIFGVEPQVFVTATTAFTVYTDAPQSAGRGADQENDDQPVTIRGAIAANNSDFVMRVVAFQLTNPFNVDVQLGADELNVKPAPVAGQQGDPYPDRKNLRWVDVADPKFPPITSFHDYFYLEFGGRQYALVRLQEQRVRGRAPLPQNPGDPLDPIKSTGNVGEYTTLSGATDGIDTVARPIIVPAGQTVVVYALSQIPRVILQNMKTLDSVYMTEQIIDDEILNDATDPVATPIPRNTSSYEFHKLIRRHIADRGLGAIGQPTTVTQSGDGRFDQDGVYWIPEFFSPEDTTNADPDKLGRLGMTLGTPDDTGGSFKLLSSGGTASFADLLTQSSGPSSPDNQVVKLWRCMRAGVPDGTQSPMIQAEQERVVPASSDNNLPDKCWNGDRFNYPANARLYVTNDRRDDLLVDRLRLPAGTDFNGHTLLPNHSGSQTNDIDSTHVNPSFGDVGDDTGFTITLWEAVHRPTDPEVVNGDEIKSGVLPAYCMERKLRVDPANALASWNITVPDDIVDRPDPWLERSKFVDGTGAHGAGDTFEHWYKDPNDLTTDNPVAVIPAVGMAPAKRADAGLSIKTPTRLNYNPSATAVEKPNFAEDRPELNVNNSAYMPKTPVLGTDPALRTVDMLAPLAVGTIHDPLSALPNSWAVLGLKQEDVTWTTLSESLCLAEGYEVAPQPQSNEPCAIRSLYPTRLDPSGNRFKRLYDHAQLKLDDYIPFYNGDNDPNGEFVENLSGPPATAEYRRGAQTPLAWNVLDVFSVRASTLDTLIPGTININTASQTVMASLPMLAPSTQTADPYLRPDPSTGNPRDDWWWKPPTAANSTGENPTSDITPTVIAARDKSTAYFRSTSILAAMGNSVSFDDSQMFAGNYSNLQGRYLQSNIFGIGEMPGFRTPGSILMSRAILQGLPNPSTTPITDGAGLPSNIDFLGHDGDSALGRIFDSSLKGVTPGVTRNWNDTTHRWDEDQTNLSANDYQEKLAIAGAVLGSTTNRSDLFAAWFVVEGFRKDDVMGLSNNQPMVPSVKRRFVMVVDRSNVRQTGDKPKILLFKEVPVD